MDYNKKDHYHRKAKEEGFLARSAYKLQEIQKKFRLIGSGSKVLDLGCAPGAWVQVTLPLVGEKGRVVGVDLEKIEVSTIADSHFRFIHGDAFKLQTVDLPEAPFDIVLSDMAPKTSGIKVRDQARSAELCLHALAVARQTLRTGGALVVKLFEGEDAESVRKEISAEFSQLKLFRPDSTRVASAEIYLIATGKRAKKP